MDKNSILELKDVEDDDFYTIEEMENMENSTTTYMAKKFLNLIFRKNKPTSIRVKHLNSTKETHPRLEEVQQDEATKWGWWLYPNSSVTTIMSLGILLLSA